MRLGRSWLCSLIVERGGQCVPHIAEEEDTKVMRGQNSGEILRLAFIEVFQGEANWTE